MRTIIYDNHFFYVEDKDLAEAGFPSSVDIEMVLTEVDDMAKWTMPLANTFLWKIVYRKEISENDIKLVYEKMPDEIRIGWIIPVAALFSKDHDKHDNKHFLVYAFPAVVLWLQHMPDSVFAQGGIEVYNSEEIEKGACIFIAESANVQNTSSLDCFDADLIKEGYSLSPSNIKTAKNATDKVKLVRMSNTFYKDEVYQNEYIKNFLNLYCYTDEPVLRFFYMYQVIEILFDECLICYFKNQIQSIQSGLANVRGVDQMVKSLTEEKRFQYIYDSFHKNSIDNLHDSSKLLLNQKGYDTTGVNFPTSLYRVRNMLVHRLRILESDNEVLNKINSEFLKYVCYLLCAYDPEKLTVA